MNCIVDYFTFLFTLLSHYQNCIHSLGQFALGAKLCCFKLILSHQKFNLYFFISLSFSSYRTKVNTYKMTESETSVKTYSLADVAKHNTNQSAWIIVHNNIYDLTGFLNEVRINVFFSLFLLLNILNGKSLCILHNIQ